MKVILALNGSITSEASAIYAIHYCRLFGYDLELLHVRNGRDAFEEVERSMEIIETLAEGAGVACERCVLPGGGVDAVIARVHRERVDTLFCTTRAQKGSFSASFSDYLTRTPLPCDVAVVRIADLAAVNRVEKVGVSIKNAQLSVEKFAFFSAMLRAFDADGEIYSISVLSQRQREAMGFEATRDRLEGLDAKLAHYRHLAQLQGVRLRLKHAFAESEVEQMLHHACHAKYDLMIVGGRRLGASALFSRKTALEELLLHTGVNLIAHYPKRNGDV